MAGRPACSAGSWWLFMSGVGVDTWVCVVTVGNHLKAKGLFLSHEELVFLVPISSWTVCSQMNEERGQM